MILESEEREAGYEMVLDAKPHPDDTVEIALLKEEVRRLRAKIHDFQQVAALGVVAAPEPLIGCQADNLRKKFEKVLLIAGAGELKH